MMSDAAPLTLILPDETATDRLGRWFAAHVAPGDTVLLSGGIGAGKTHFARSLIRARLGAETEVPSPTYTLVQSYEDAAGDIWHSDLYRLGHPDEIAELGLEAAFGTAICLVEWPERLGDLAPAHAIALHFRPDGDGRRVEIAGPSALLATLRADWQDARQAHAEALLSGAGWAGATRRFLAGDASDRSYLRLVRPGGSAVLMDAPPGKGDDPRDFLRIARHLRGLGLSAPEILAEDPGHGFLLLEDLGDDIYARLLRDRPELELPLYHAAADVLLHLQSSPAPASLPDLGAEDWAEAAAFALDWYRRAITGDTGDRPRFVALLAEALRRHADGPRVLILRDFHAENLLWLPERTGLARVGLLDFQLAQMGQPGYDLVSLLQDARRDVAAETEAAVRAHFRQALGVPEESFDAAYATLGAQRALRILGIFARLCLVAGKPGYLRLIPRVWGQLWRNLGHPALRDLADLCRDLLPEPHPDTLRILESRCAPTP